MMNIETYQDTIYNLLKRVHGMKEEDLDQACDKLVSHCFMKGRNPIVAANAIAAHWMLRS